MKALKVREHFDLDEVATLEVEEGSIPFNLSIVNLYEQRRGCYVPLDLSMFAVGPSKPNEVSLSPNILLNFMS